jgi:hypothetical protein
MLKCCEAHYARSLTHSIINHLLAPLASRACFVSWSFALPVQADALYPIVSGASIVAKVIRDRSLTLLAKVRESFPQCAAHHTHTSQAAHLSACATLLTLHQARLSLVSIPQHAVSMLPMHGSRVASATTVTTVAVVLPCLSPVSGVWCVGGDTLRYWLSWRPGHQGLAQGLVAPLVGLQAPPAGQVLLGNVHQV